LGPGVGGGGPLLFIIKSPFNAKISITGGGSPAPLKGKESASLVDNERGITGSAGCFLLGPKKTIGAASNGAGMGMYPFVKKSPSLVASPMGGIGSFGSGGGLSGVAFVAKISITGGGSPMPLKGEESASSVDTEHGITDGGGTFLLGPKKIIGVASGGTDETASFMPPKGVLGKVLPLSLKEPLSSFKGNVDVSERHGNDSASSTTVNELIGPLEMSPFSSPTTPLKGAEVFASAVGVKAPNMTGPLKMYSFLESLSKGKRFEEMKANDGGNIATPTKGSFVELLGKGYFGATMKAKSDGVSSTLTNKSFGGSFSKETLVEMKAKGAPLPLSHPLKGMQVSSGANVGTGFPFVKKSIILNKDGAGTPTARTSAAGAIGTSSKANLVGKSGPGVGGGGPLPFLIKSPFNAPPKKSVE
jgi:hypothetical protein